MNERYTTATPEIIHQIHKEMDTPASKYSSRSESGWTLYFEESLASRKHFPPAGVADFHHYRGKGARITVEYEDLSMVSDASSGPPLCIDSHEEYFCENGSAARSSSSSKSIKVKRKNKSKEYSRRQDLSYLDDTASSHVFLLDKKREYPHYDEDSENAAGFCHEMSAARNKRNPIIQRNLGFFQSSLAGKEGTGDGDKDWK